MMVLFMISCTYAYGQDPQFSQYYSAPLVLNPAMTGNTDCYRAGFNARSQWLGLPGGAFNTASVFIDMYHPDIRSGFGLLVLHDVIGTPKMSSTEISGFYSFLAPVSKMLNFRFGIQATYVSRGVDYSRLIFEDQYSGITVTGPSTADPVTDYPNANYADFSAGALIFGEDKYWIGFSAHHLTQPEQAFYRPESRLPVKYSIHGGINININKNPYKRKEGFRIIPTFMYKAQARHDQFDVGVYAIKEPLLLGITYRGIPAKTDEGVRNRDAVSVQAGIRYGDFAFAYSYDFTVSKLGWFNTHGSHEISLTYLFCLDWPRRKKPARSSRRLPCPDFQRSLKYDGNF